MLELDLSLRRAAFTLELRATLERPLSALYGPSGCGKTTLLDLVAGLLCPDRGVIRLDGELLSDASRSFCLPPERRRLGYVFQEGRLFPHLRVAENLRYGLKRREAQGPGFGEVVEMLAIGELLRRQPDSLSGGQRQRVALGRALLASPRLLLLDEPLSSLDGGLKDRILPYLRSSCERFGIPALYVSHLPAEIVALADDLLVLDAGRLTVQGNPSEILGLEPRS